MGRMKELLDQRLEENKWDMYELLRKIIDRRPPKYSSECSYRLIFTLDDAETLINKIESLEVINSAKEGKSNVG